MDREIPIILDDLADPEFGTGVVKVTPAHDPNDFEAGKPPQPAARSRSSTRTAMMTAAAGPYAGLDRFEARKRVVADLEELGAARKRSKTTRSASARCQRCKTVVEPLVSTQWFVKIKPLAEKAIAAVESGSIEFVPANWTKTYFEWMYNIRDWCISRQLWWGHRIPGVALRRVPGNHRGARDAHRLPALRLRRDLEQDTDVLDTWFSSGLWPFSTLGWPDQTADLADVLPDLAADHRLRHPLLLGGPHGHAGLRIHGRSPVPPGLHPRPGARCRAAEDVEDASGNVVDPLVVTEKYGTDAVRMALLQGAAPGTDIVLTEERMESSRAFANKIWNAARFLFLNMERSGVEPWVPGPRLMRPEPEPGAPGSPDRRPLDLQPPERRRRNRQPRHRAVPLPRSRAGALALLLARVLRLVPRAEETELTRIRAAQLPRPTTTGATSWRPSRRALRLLHPAMPFLTEELWQRLAANQPQRPQSIALAHYPQYNEEAADLRAEVEMAILQEIITSARALRADHKIDKKLQLPATIWSINPAGFETAQRDREAIERLANLKLELNNETAPKLQGAVRSTPEFDLILHLPETDTAALKARLVKEIQQLEKLIANSERQLSNEEFMSKAPEKVVNGIRSKLADYQAQLEKSRKTLESLGG